MTRTKTAFTGIGEFRAARARERRFQILGSTPLARSRDWLTPSLCDRSLASPVWAAAHGEATQEIPTDW